MHFVSPHIFIYRHQDDRNSVAKYDPLSKFVGFSVSLMFEIWVFPGCNGLEWNYTCYSSLLWLSAEMRVLWFKFLAGLLGNMVFYIMRWNGIPYVQLCELFPNGIWKRTT